MGVSNSKYKPKFAIDDIVCFANDFSSNPAYKTLTIAKVESINIHRGKGMYVGEDARGKISYSLTGIGLIMSEDKLAIYKES